MLSTRVCSGTLHVLRQLRPWTSPELSHSFKRLTSLNRSLASPAKLTGISRTDSNLQRGMCAHSDSIQADGARAPNPRLSIEAVMLVQILALQRRDYGTVFAFASPSNQAFTGPLSRFTSMLQNPVYEPMLGHVEADILSTTQPTPRSAEVLISVTPADNPNRRGGNGLREYRFTLTLQGPGALEGCWVTDAVQ